MENAKNSFRRVHCTAHGEVQGVGFRAFTARQAGELGLCGWVRNLMDGSVEIEVEGPEEKVTIFLSLIRQGPRHSHVEGLELHEDCRINELVHNDFSVRF